MRDNSLLSSRVPGDMKFKNVNKVNINNRNLPNGDNEKALLRNLKVVQSRGSIPKIRVSGKLKDIF